MPVLTPIAMMEVTAQNCFFPTPLIRPADELCDELLDHMLDCTACLNGDEATCTTWQELQHEIRAAGKPRRAMLLAI